MFLQVYLTSEGESQMKNRVFVLGLVGLSLLFNGCATTYKSNLEEALSALNSANYASAVSAGTSAVAANDTIEARRILASAYLGRGNVDFHELAIKLLNLESETDTNYQVLAEQLSADTDLDDLALAIATLEAIDGIDSATLSSDELKDAAYDLGLMYLVQHYAIGIVQSGFAEDTTTFDATLLDADDRSAAATALINFDNYLIASGFDVSSEGSFINEARSTHCLLQAVDDGTEGFTLTEYQAFVACELAPADTVPTDIDAGFTSCVLANPDSDTHATAVTDCFEEDTVLE